MVKHNWPQLKAEFLKGDWLTVTSFLRDKGINPKVRWPQIIGWGDEKKKLSDRILANRAAGLVATSTADVNEARLRQARIARYLQLTGMSAVKMVKPEDMSPEDARKYVATGLEQERRALGIDESGSGAQNLTQININSGPKTNIDKLIENLDYEGTLKLIAELKRDRERRTAPTTSVGGSGKVQEGEII